MSTQVANAIAPVFADKENDSEVSVRPKRRTFEADYKLRILREADACSVAGERGALLRREGLYSSHLTEWRRARERGALAALSEKRGRKVKPQAAADEELARLRKENQRLEKRLEQAELIIDVQKKVASLLGIPLKSPESDGSGS
jgi:transposase